MSERRFPVLMSYHERKLHPEVPRDVPWTFIEPGRDQAMRNHDQTLERLAERGGLGPGEMRCALEKKRLFDHYDGTSNAGREAADVAWLMAKLREAGHAI